MTAAERAAAPSAPAKTAFMLMSLESDDAGAGGVAIVKRGKRDRERREGRERREEKRREGERKVRLLASPQVGHLLASFARRASVFPVEHVVACARVFWGGMIVPAAPRLGSRPSGAPQNPPGRPSKASRTRTDGSSRLEQLAYRMRLGAMYSMRSSVPQSARSTILSQRPSSPNSTSCGSGMSLHDIDIDIDCARSRLPV